MHLGLGGGEVSNLLTAEDSSEVADEGEDDRPVFPGVAQRYRAAVFVTDGEGSQSCRERAAHGAILRASAAPRPRVQWAAGGPMTSNAEMFKVYDVEGREYLDFVLGSGPRARS